MATQPDPRLVEAAKNDPTLAYMIKKGIPLTRERWIKLNWLADPPQPWGLEHEMEVPELLQDHTKVEGWTASRGSAAPQDARDALVADLVAFGYISWRAYRGGGVTGEP